MFLVQLRSKRRSGRVRRLGGPHLQPVEQIRRHARSADWSVSSGLENGISSSKSTTKPENWQYPCRCALLALLMALCALFPNWLFVIQVSSEGNEDVAENWTFSYENHENSWFSSSFPAKLLIFIETQFYVFQLSAVIDIASHWLHLHATDLSGASSHKQSTNWLLNLYYTDRMFLGFMCGGNEAFYILLYIRAFWAGWFLWGIQKIWWISMCTTTHSSRFPGILSICDTWKIKKKQF